MVINSESTEKDTFKVVWKFHYVAEGYADNNVAMVESHMPDRSKVMILTKLSFLVLQIWALDLKTPPK
jgi:hypothetical protein